MEPMETEPARRVPSGCSVGRIVNILLAFHFLLIMITALVVVGILGALDLTVRRMVSCWYTAPKKEGHCTSTVAIEFI